MATITIDDDLLAKLEEKAKSESREVEAVANELLRKALPYKLELKGWQWNAKLLVDVADRNKLYDILDDDESMKKRGF